MIYWRQTTAPISYHAVNTVRRGWAVWSQIRHRITHCNAVLTNAHCTSFSSVSLCTCRPDGAVVPLGTSKDTGITNPSGYTLNYNGKYYGWALYKVWTVEVLTAYFLIKCTPFNCMECFTQIKSWNYSSLNMVFLF